MNDLSKLPNIGKVLADKLNEIGIQSKEDLINSGAEEAFIKLKEKDISACINMLYAIEGAIQDIRWHGITKERKTELKAFYESIK